MIKHLPPLNAVRAFESAAKHLSFTKAAEELHVTQAAISHQIKHLEDYLALKLFTRINKRLILTEEGQMYAPIIREALEQIANATETLSSRNKIGSITVSTLPSFAAKWLVPRLWKFRDENPDIDVRLSAFEWLVDFEKDNIDLAIRYGKGQWAGMQSELLMQEKVFPVCSPQLLNDPKKPLKTPEDLRFHTLLHDDFAREGWKKWLNAANTSTVNPERGPSFSHTSIMLEAAESGQGIALGRTPLVIDDIAKGRLAKPFNLSLSAEYNYYVVIPDQNANKPQVEIFRNWLLAEATNYQTFIDELNAKFNN